MKTVHCNGYLLIPSKVVCAVRNFPAHGAEVGERGRPFNPAVFIKPNSSIASGDLEVRVPAALGILHHEVELCFIVGARLNNVSSQDAQQLIMGYAVGLDLTLRTIQSRAKADRLPWTVAKGFDNSAVLGTFLAADEVSRPFGGEICLSVNGRQRQCGHTRDMIFSCAELLSYASRYMTIEPGDVFMCGTPAGVGELSHDDAVVARISDLPVLEVTVKRT